jgi:sugar lactone lactonase YvrE
VDAKGMITTIAGVCGERGDDGDGGPAVEALLNRPYGVALDRDGNLYIADTHNHRIRVVWGADAR